MRFFDVIRHLKEQMHSRYLTSVIAPMSTAAMTVQLKVAMRLMGNLNMLEWIIVEAHLACLQPSVIKSSTEVPRGAK
jgi:uncharacterized membrane protein